MKQFFVWFFLSPSLFFGLWLIGLYSPQIRTDLINNIERLLKAAMEEIERRI
jgi:hypothetical protein